MFEDRGKQEIAAFDTVSSALVEEAVSSAEPAACSTDLPSTREADADPEGAAQGRQRPAAIEVGAMSTLEETEVLRLATEHVGGGGDQLEVTGSKRVGLVRGRQRFVRLVPGLVRAGLRPRSSSATTATRRAGASGARVEAAGRPRASRHRSRRARDPRHALLLRPRGPSSDPSRRLSPASTASCPLAGVRSLPGRRRRSPSRAGRGRDSTRNRTASPTSPA